MASFFVWITRKARSYQNRKETRGQKNEGKNEPAQPSIP